MLKVGNDEPGEPLGELWDCGRCGQVHEVESGSMDLLQFVRCGEGLYLVGVDGYAVNTLDRTKGEA